MKTRNETKAVLRILKSPEREYNANNLSKVIGITSMGALKILRKLEKEEILLSKKISNISFYKINFNNPYTLDYAIFSLKSEAEHSSSHVKRWVSELRKIRGAEIAVIFGSILRAGKKAKDIDVLFVVKKNRFGALKEEIRKINLLGEKKIHPVFQLKKDLLKNLRKEDVVVLNAIKGVVVFGEKEFVNLLGGIK